MNRTSTILNPVVPGRTDGLRELKNRLLREWLERNAELPTAIYGRLPSLAAGEAEAIAWQTEVPLLVFPALFEEKLEDIRRYTRRPAPA